MIRHTVIGRNGKYYVVPVYANGQLVGTPGQSYWDTSANAHLWASILDRRYL